MKNLRVFLSQRKEKERSPENDLIIPARPVTLNKNLAIKTPVKINNSIHDTFNTVINSLGKTKEESLCKILLSETHNKNT